MRYMQCVLDEEDVAYSLRGKRIFDKCTRPLLRGDLRLSKELTDHENLCIANCVLCGS